MSAEAEVTESPTMSIDTIDPDSFWNEIVWPIMARLFREHGPLNKELLSTNLGVKTTQADEWFKRAVEDEKLQKKRNPVRYVIPDGKQETLLSDN